MICPRCGKKDVSVFFKQIVNNKVTELQLCADCAAAADLPAGALPAPVFELLASLAGKPAAQPAARRPRPKACPGCGLTYAEFRERGKLGCASCYDAFAAQLGDLLKHIHGSARHAGKTPPASPAETPRRRAEEAGRVRAQLEKAVKAERFEEAARLRDALRTLEG